MHKDKTSAPPSAAGASCKLESAEDQVLAAELLNYRQLQELHLATAPGSEAVSLCIKSYKTIYITITKQ